MADILIVDDDKQIIQQLTALLRQFGYNSHATVYPQYLLQTLELEPVDLILMDIFMPEIDGITLLKQVKSDPLYSSIPVIMLTGDDNEKLLTQCFDVGAIDFITKPFSESVLRARLQSALSVQTYIKQLKSINTQMSEFVGIVSHDLRTPVGNLTSLCDVLAESPEMLQEALPLMQQSSKQALQLITDLLDLTSMENGKIKMHLTACNFAEVAQCSVQDISIVASRKKIQIKTDLVSTEDMVYADGSRILQVIINLLNNAVKFTPTGGFIQLRTTKEENGLLIEIEDSGVGIRKDVIPKLFSKHEKISTKGTEGESGTGYGLPLAQEIIYAHHSEIIVKSELGKGTTFSFLLQWWRGEEKEL